MNYSNPSLMEQIFGGARSSTSKPVPNVSPNQFFALTSTLDKQSLQKLVAQARAQGISDTDIKSGLDILLQHR